MALYYGNIDPQNDVDFYKVQLNSGETVTADIDDGYDEADGDFLDTILTVSAEKRPFFLVAARPDGMPGARGASG